MNKGQFRETHGLKKSRSYTCWTNMKQRCLNPNHKSYKDYGGRGIKICDEWLNSFEAFYRDMGEQERGMTIERVDVNGDYCPENCTWADRKRQQRNTTCNKILTHNGESRTLAEWSEMYGINHQTLSYRILNGWPVHEALNAKAYTRNRIAAKLGDEVDVPEELV